MRFLRFTFIFLSLSFHQLQAQISIDWKSREDLNILLPNSVRIYEGNGKLADSARVRAVYAKINLKDHHLTLQAKGSNPIRQTTLEAYQEHDGILAINGGYFSSTQSVSLLVSNGEIISPDRNQKVTRGAFGLVNGKPEIAWAYVKDNQLVNYPSPINPIVDKLEKGMLWNPSQAVGGGPVLIKNGKINVSDTQEGFGGSHLVRHPRTAIGYMNDSTLVMMVVDGRQVASVGVTLTELAEIMLNVGCYEAVNLDGGGSSAMVAADEVVNIPVDVPAGNRNSLRKNASALIISHTKPGIDKKIIIIDTDNKNYNEQGVWRNTNHSNNYGITNSRTATASTYNKATYRFDSLTSGNYQLAAWWTVDAGNSTTTKYILHHENKIDTLRVSQKDLSGSGKWNVLGNFHLQTNAYLEVIGDKSENKIITDAIRLVAHELYPALPKRGDLRIALISDLNSGLGSATYEWQVDSIMKRIPRIWKPDIVICGGDMVAGMGVHDTLVMRKMWEGFAKHVTKPLQDNNIPFAFTLGNHDGTVSHQDERKFTQRYWSNRVNTLNINFIDKSHFPAYYSFTKDNVFFISIDASSPSMPKENIEWLETQLKSKEAQQSKIRFVLGHIPLYSVAQERDSKGNVLESHQQLQQLLEKYNVHSYISGHQHAYYPGKNGTLMLLNAGAAGSGPRRWLNRDDAPVNTVTMLDVFFDADTVVQTTYDIKQNKSEKMAILIQHSMSSSISGVNGTIIRDDLPYVQSVSGNFYANDSYTSLGAIALKLANNKIVVEGNVNLNISTIGNDSAIALYAGKHTEQGSFLLPLTIKKNGKNSIVLKGEMEAQDTIREWLATGALFVKIKTKSGSDIRAQLYPDANHTPTNLTILSHTVVNIYGIRNTEALYTVSWSEAFDQDGDLLDYAYELATDSLFNHIVVRKNTGRQTQLKFQEKEWFTLIDQPIGKISTFYHRVITSDGKHFTKSPITKLNLMKSDELPDDYIEVSPPQYTLEKITNAPGTGSGAVWDKDGKLWLADYSGNLIIKSRDGSDAPFSPLKSVIINGKEHSLKPINGIGLDNDGNILIGNNRFLLKIDATTGKVIARWEAPEGERAITTPRMNTKGEIYAMSLFGDDPNYVLKQSTTDPATFELLRTINLKDRILARTFDMSNDGHTLYFPDPGSPFIQVYKSKDGIMYRREENITSMAAGSNAIQTIDEKIFAAVRASGITPTMLHYRDDSKRVMWTLSLPEMNGAEPRGITVSEDGSTIIICSWDKGGGFYRVTLKP
ncbi:MAG: phosphodiester glycosidase family protein [Cyclobacteriaceae bacterium]|jgi:predicted phosphodiesterase|nr:phosphodiester glycosidase family protein [Cyclobacteriaceae bacterium]